MKNSETLQFIRPTLYSKIFKKSIYSFISLFTNLHAVDNTGAWVAVDISGKLYTVNSEVFASAESAICFSRWRL